VFSVGGRDYEWLDIFLAAMLRGEWRAFERRLVEALACLAEASEEQYWPDADRIDAAASAFRYDRDLLTSDATMAWIEQEGLTPTTGTTSWWDASSSRWSDQLARVDRHAPSPTVTDGAFAAEGICSRAFDAWASTLAGRAAVAATASNVELEHAPIDDARLERARRDHSAWLEPIEPAILADRLMFLDRLHSTFDAQARARTTPEALTGQLTRNRLEGMRVDLERLSFATAMRRAKRRGVCSKTGSPLMTLPSI
jgi:hypothetical protein